MGDSSLIGRPTFGGLATGLDTKALLDGLLALERQPLDRIKSRRAQVDGQRGLMRDLNTKLLALRTAAQELDNRNSTGNDASLDEEFLRYAGSSTDEEIVTVSASSGAAPGDIDIVVNQLARGSRRFSESFTETAAETALSAGQSITIDLPNADPDADPPFEPITVTAEGNLSLQNLRDQINTHPDNVGKVRADILTIGDDDFRLVFTTSGTGTENVLEITGDLALREANPDGSDDAQDASFTIFGETITRSSNAVDDVLSGITFQLNSLSEIDEGVIVGEGEPPVRLSETVTVEVDVEEVAAALEKFTNAYNDVVGFIGRQFSYNESTKQSGPLAGDSTLQSIQAQLRDIVSDGYSFANNPNNPFATGDIGGAISGIGIELVSGGTLRVNKEKLEEALALDALSVRQFLSGQLREGEFDADGNEIYDVGFAQTMAARLEDIVRTGDGALAERDKGYAERLKTFDDSIARFERRLTQREETLIARFSALEGIVAGLQSQQGFLSGLGV